MFSLLIFLAVLSVLVLIHELGHYVAARLCGVKADEFGYGFPPRLIGFVRHRGKWKRVPRSDQTVYQNTIWSINCLPLGGFVRLKGEQGEAAQDSDSFLAKGIWSRLFILAAGVMMNWLLAAVIFIVAFLIGVPILTDQLPKGAIVRDQKIQIVEVMKGSAADKAGIQMGDFIVKINVEGVNEASRAQELLKTHALDPQGFQIVVERGGEEKTFSATSEYIESLQRPGLGVALSNTGIVRFPWYRAIEQGIVTTGHYTKLIVMGLFGLLRDLFTQGRVTADVAGPVGIAVMTSHIARQGVWSLAQFMALLSLNLAVVNFLPIPALDGGRALFVFVESLRRRRTNPRFEALTHQIGFIALLFLIAIVTLHDLRQYGGVILRGIVSLF